MPAPLLGQHGGGDGDGLVPVGDEASRTRFGEGGAGAVRAAAVVDGVALAVDGGFTTR
ncbi:hypothetical protein [Streptomyces sp. WELS2]|uniref:hypothetical protein n=1 Tax=Streptomyces sp. WELS2 TaxID=2749435 RepID=UPI0015F10531|nr:hypothetical protein [Streptomyces sp. WELS2]